MSDQEIEPWRVAEAWQTDFKLHCGDYIYDRIGETDRSRDAFSFRRPGRWICIQTVKPARAFPNTKDDPPGPFRVIVTFDKGTTEVFTVPTFAVLKHTVLEVL